MEYLNVEQVVGQRTPGPWRVDVEGNRILATDPRETIVCHLSASCRNPDVFADALLISFAPDLLNALRSLLRHAERVNEEIWARSKVISMDHGPLDVAREVIAKATGEERKTTE